MSQPDLHPHTATDAPLLDGESPIAQAPVIMIDGQTACIPQHFLQYAHSRRSVEALLSRITYDPHFQVFVGEEASQDSPSLYIQIGIIGPDNYGLHTNRSRPKIVFGRRWRVEPNLPTSEIIQTVFLALKKAREHEIRERFTLRVDHRVTTPFNNHHDLPLMARRAEAFEARQTPCDIDVVIAAVRYGNRRFHVEAHTPLPTGQTVTTLRYDVQNESEAEFLNASIHVIWDRDATNPGADFLHGFIHALIEKSDAHVDAHFRFDGFARFSKSVDPFAIAALSVAVRQTPASVITDTKTAGQFNQNFEAERYETDATRIPALPRSPYNDALRETLSAFDLSNYALVCGAHMAPQSVEPKS